MASGNDENSRNSSRLPFDDQHTQHNLTISQVKIIKCSIFDYTRLNVICRYFSEEKFYQKICKADSFSLFSNTIAFYLLLNGSGSSLIVIIPPTIDKTFQCQGPKGIQKPENWRFFSGNLVIRPKRGWHRQSGKLTTISQNPLVLCNPNYVSTPVETIPTLL